MGTLFKPAPAWAEQPFIHSYEDGSMRVLCEGNDFMVHCEMILQTDGECVVYGSI